VPKPKVKKRRVSRASQIINELNDRLDLETPLRLGSDEYFEITRVPTGSLVIDRITGGGFAHGRHIELYGDESACKSFIAYKTMALSQRRGNIAALVDPEHSFDPDWFSRLGGDPDELILQQPDSAEDGVAVMMMLAKIAKENSELEIIVIDSVSSLVPLDDTKKDPRENERIAGQARMMSRALRLITTMNGKTIFIWINQERTNVGIQFGNPKTTSGGKALRFYASSRIELRKGTAVKAKRKIAKANKLVESDVLVGRWISARAEKDKTTRPYRQGSFIFDGDEGNIDLGSEIVQLALEDGLVENRGNNYSYIGLDDKEIKGSYKRFKAAITKDDEVRQELIDQITDNSNRTGEENGEGDD
jgi:recombination protein RecA